MDASVLSRKLSKRSKEIFYDVYAMFDWPDTLPRDQYWLSRECLSVFNTPAFHEYSETTLIHLSHLETINLFSVFAHGESALIQNIIKNMFAPELEDVQEYLFHFVDEENKHMWFFTEFCKRYGEGVYEHRELSLPSKFTVKVEQFLGFVRILLFEEFGDFFNMRVMRDMSIPTFVRQIHERHHLDEVGHIAIGWKIAETLLQRFTENEKTVIENVKSHLNEYMNNILANLYNPDVYSTIGLGDSSYGLRRELLHCHGRAEMHKKIYTRAHARLVKVFADV